MGDGLIRHPVTVDVIATADNLSLTYRRYLRSLLPVRDPELAPALRDAIDGSPMLTKGPVLEATPPYQTGASLRDLIADGVLPGRVRPARRPRAARWTGRCTRTRNRRSARPPAGRNLVVATGTGSGKTESFLLPVLSALVAERDAEKLGPGVRALLLYPMNALANDQVRRLRQVLANTPDITFGRYTGDTPERARRGASLFDALNPGETRLPNELLSPARRCATPRRTCCSPTTRCWSTCCSARRTWTCSRARTAATGGSSCSTRRTSTTGRRPRRSACCCAASSTRPSIQNGCGCLRNRVPLRLQVIATSATVGRQPRRPSWTSPASCSTRRSSGPRATRPGRTWSGPRGSRCPTARIGDVPGLAPEDAAGLGRVRALLAAGPLPFTGLARAAEVSGRRLAELVTLGAATATPVGTPGALRPLPPVRPGHRGRVHLPDGRVIRWDARRRSQVGGAQGSGARGGPHVALARREVCPDCSAAVFEFGCCKRCGAVYLTGIVDRDGTGEYFTSRVARGDRRSWLLLGDDPLPSGGEPATTGTGPGAVDEDDAAFEEAAETVRRKPCCAASAGRCTQ